MTKYGMALDTKIKLEEDNGINLGMTFLGLERYYLRLTNAAVISILPLDRLFNSIIYISIFFYFREFCKSPHFYINFIFIIFYFILFVI